MTAPRPAPPGELRAQLTMAVPLAAQHMGLQLMGLVDIAMLGRYHPDALGGSGVANSLVFTITCVGMGIVMGLDALVPQALGAGRPDRAGRLLMRGLRVAVLVGLPATLLVLLMPQLLPVAGVDPDVAWQAEVYTYARSFGVLPFMLQTALRSFLAAHGKTRPLLIAVIVGNLVNAVANWILIFGDRGLADLGLPELGLPAFGVIGAAMATTSVQIVTLVVYALAARAILADRRAPAQVITSEADEPDPVRRIFALGTPIGLQMLAEVGAFSLSSVLAATMGKVPASAHQVALQLASFTFSMALGIGAAASVRVGHAVGGGDHRAARRAGVTSLGLGAVAMSASAIIFLLYAVPLASLFTDDPAVVAAAVPLLQIAAAFQLADGAQAVAAGALRGAGDTRATFVANLIGHYALGLGVSVVCGFTLGMGAPGLWWGLTTGLVGTAAVLIGRFLWLSSRPIRRA